MRHCQNPCEGCPVGTIEDSEKRELVGGQVGEVFSHFKHQELRSAERNGEILVDRLIRVANSHWDNGAWKLVNPTLDFELVRSAVLYIANERCSAHRYRTSF
jgi:hypothetical protein